MNDPFGSMQGFIEQFQQFMGNPMQFMMNKKLNIPQEFQGNPHGAIQHLMNTGQMDQQTYNRLQSMARQIQSNPMFARMFGIDT